MDGCVVVGGLPQGKLSGTESGERRGQAHVFVGRGRSQIRHRLLIAADLGQAALLLCGRLFLCFS